MTILKGNYQKNTLDGGADNDRLFGYGDIDILNGNNGNVPSAGDGLASSNSCFSGRPARRRAVIRGAPPLAHQRDRSSSHFLGKDTLCTHGA